MDNFNELEEHIKDQLENRIKKYSIKKICQKIVMVKI